MSLLERTPISAETAAARARKGAAWLDVKRPGWHEEINLSRLDIGSGQDCLIAQLNGDNFSMGLWKMDPDWSLDTAAHGFMGASVADERALNHAWRTLILRRLHGELPPLRIRLRAAVARVLRRVFLFSAA